MNDDQTVHCDEALACAMLKILPEWSDAVIVRTRDPAELAKCTAVVDVGGVYDAETLRYYRPRGGEKKTQTAITYEGNCRCYEHARV